MGMGLFDIDQELGGDVIIPQDQMTQLISGGIEVKPEGVTPEVKPETTFVDRTLEQMGILTGKGMSTGEIDIPKQPSIIIRDLGTALIQLDEQDKLKEGGKRVLNNLRKGGFLDPSIATVTQGATVGLSDELIAMYEQFSKSKDYGDVVDMLAEGVENLYDGRPIFMTPYSVSTGVQRAEMKEFQEEYPKTALGLDIGGSLLTAGGLEKATRKSGLFKDAPKFKEMIGKGGLYGGLAGFGYGEGDPYQQAISTGAGIGLGTGAGLAFGIASPVISAGIEKTIDAFKPQKVFESSQAKKFIKDAIERGYGSTDEALLDFVNRSTGKQFTIDQLDQAKQLFSEKGSNKPFALADLDDETRSLLDVFRQLPSAEIGMSKKWFDNRRKGQMQRLQTDVKQAFGRTGEIFSEINAIKAVKSRVGSDNYKRAFQINVNPNFKHNVNGEKISMEDLFKTPQFQEAFQKANYLAQTQSYSGVGKDFLKYTLKPNGKVFVQKTVKVKGKDVVKETELTQIPTEFLHNMKMGLDDAIESYINQEGYKGNILRSYLDSKNAFLQMFDASNPQYKNARNFYAGLRGTEDAYIKGQNLFSIRSDQLYTNNPNHAENITMLINSMSEAEKEAFRSGAVRGIIDKLGGMMQQGEEVLTGKDFTRYFITDPAKLRLIRATFGDTKAGQKGFSEFVKNIKIESDMYNTYRAMQGSQTQPRQEKLRQVFETQYSSNTDLMGKIAGFLNRSARDVDERQMERINAEVVSYLSTFEKKQILKIFEGLNDSNPQKAYNAISDLIIRSRNASINPFVTGTTAGQYGVNTQQMVFENPVPNRTGIR